MVSPQALPWGGIFFDSGRDEILDLAAAAYQVFAVWGHDVAVAVADSFIQGDAAFGPIVVLPSKLDKSQCYSGGLLLGWVA